MHGDKKIKDVSYSVSNQYRSRANVNIFTVKMCSANSEV